MYHLNVILNAYNNAKYYKNKIYHQAGILKEQVIYNQPPCYITVHSHSNLYDNWKNRITRIGL